MFDGADTYELINSEKDVSQPEAETSLSGCMLKIKIYQKNMSPNRSRQLDRAGFTSEISPVYLANF